MARNKVIYKDEVLIDLTSDTVSASTMFGVLVAAVALYYAIAESMPAPDLLEEEEYKRKLWYK